MEPTPRASKREIIPNSVLAALPRRVYESLKPGLESATLKFGDLPAEAVANVKLMVLDALGCAIAATTLGDGCRESMAVMCRLGGAPESTIIGTADKVSAPNAAFANGALVHASGSDATTANGADANRACWSR